MTHKLLTIIELHPSLSQRELAIEMCFSLGKSSYCINGLIEKGKITARYLKLKVHEYENIRIEKLRQEVSASSYESQKQLTEVDKIWNPTR